MQPWAWGSDCGWRRERAWSWDWRLEAGAEAQLWRGTVWGKSLGLARATKREVMAFSSPWQRCGSEQEELPNFASQNGLASNNRWVISDLICVRFFDESLSVCLHSMFYRHSVQINMWCTLGSYTKFLFTRVRIYTPEYKTLHAHVVHSTYNFNFETDFFETFPWPQQNLVVI